MIMFYFFVFVKVEGCLVFKGIWNKINRFGKFLEFFDYKCFYIFLECLLNMYFN